ncbi:MAG: PIN domain-containing protein [Acidobacteria bacterium]|nr:PIN domain-containing protein [Acidobacteriota bacterium]
MSNKRLLLDTVFVQALLNQRDQYHDKAKTFLPRVRAATEVWITEAVLIEIGNALSAFNRQAAAQFIRQCYQTANVRVVSVDSILLKRATQLYDTRSDKTWGLTDCISFVVMQEQGLTDAVTADEHFVQAGFRALLLED